MQTMTWCRQLIRCCCWYTVTYQLMSVNVNIYMLQLYINVTILKREKCAETNFLLHFYNLIKLLM